MSLYLSTDVTKLPAIDDHFVLLCRSRMDVRVANTKFLEGMMVISYVREMWDLSKLHVGEVNSSGAAAATH
jgi:hypothetical protein